MAGDENRRQSTTMDNKQQKKKKRKRSLEEGQQLQQRKKELAAGRMQLPVYQYKKEVCRLLSEKDVLLVVAETGSGKSTQIPAYLDESGDFSRRKGDHARSICVTQPRRVAAMTVARRVAEERGCAIATAVGYRVRFDDSTTPNTRILYATDGMLLREAMSDPLLSRYSVVVLDESHERSLQTDVLFGVVQRAMRARGAPTNKNSEDIEDDNTQKEISVDERIQQNMRARAEEWGLPRLKVVVMSATLDVETFQAFFPGAATVKIPGRLFPVQIVYTKEPQEVSYPLWGGYMGQRGKHSSPNHTSHTPSLGLYRLRTRNSRTNSPGGRGRRYPHFPSRTRGH
jgi:ATP-dependent RNA helicase DHX8/PRP22